MSSMAVGSTPGLIWVRILSGSSRWHSHVHPSWSQWHGLTSVGTDICGEAHQVPIAIVLQGRHWHPTTVLPPSLKYFFHQPFHCGGLGCPVLIFCINQYVITEITTTPSITDAATTCLCI